MKKLILGLSLFLFISINCYAENAVVNIPHESDIYLIHTDTITSASATGSVHIGSSAANGTRVEPDGTITLRGDATVFRDAKIYLTSSKLGANNKPDFDETNVGYLFPQSDTSEKLYIVIQIPSDYKEATSIIPHIHWLQVGSSTATFKLDYMWTNQGDSTSTFTTSACDSGEYNYTSGAIQQHSNFPIITGTGKKINSIFVARLYRDDNFVSGDVLTWEFDLHYEVDSLGARTITSK